MTLERPTLEFYSIDKTSNFCLPIYISDVSAGFPSPADDFIDKVIDLNKELIRNPAATFCVRVKGDSMIDANINNGDILIVDKSLTANDNSIILAILEGNFTIKRLQLKNNVCFLVPENKKYKPIRIHKETDFEVWGVVSYIIHKA